MVEFWAKWIKDALKQANKQARQKKLTGLFITSILSRFGV